MNKYQKFALEIFSVYSTGLDGSREKTEFEDDKILVYQNEDYNKCKYKISVYIGTGPNVIESVEIYNGKWIKCENNTFEFDFNNPITKLRINTLVVDPIVLNIEPVFADKDAFDLKMKELNREALMEKAKIRCSTGVSLVNIYFQPCCDKYSYTKIKLYLAKGEFSTWNPGGGSFCAAPDNWLPSLLSGKIEQLIGDYKVDDGALFKSITGLADRVYGYTVAQYDKNDVQLFETGPKYFVIR